ncbi:hypothetical protein [Halosegnis longus]|uniref:hypothetical protein n=1 Tax=Halosegnis longus TaxID=2216012 RepID=UPI0011CE37B7
MTPGYSRPSGYGDLRVEWSPTGDVEHPDGSTTDAAHVAATALVNCSTGIGPATVAMDSQPDLTQEEADAVREEFDRLVETPEDVDTGLVSP